MVRKIFLVLAIFVTTMTISIAHQGATGIVKERMDAMSDVSDRSKKIAKMFKGEKDLDREYIQQSSESFARYGQALFTQFRIRARVEWGLTPKPCRLFGRIGTGLKFRSINLSLLTVTYR